MSGVLSPSSLGHLRSLKEIRVAITVPPFLIQFLMQKHVDNDRKPVTKDYETSQSSSAAPRSDQSTYDPVVRPPQRRRVTEGMTSRSRIHYQQDRREFARPVNGNVATTSRDLQRTSSEPPGFNPLLYPLPNGAFGMVHFNGRQREHRDRRESRRGQNGTETTSPDSETNSQNSNGHEGVFASRRFVRKRKEYCRDYHYRGLCLFGEHCRYLHTNCNVTERVHENVSTSWNSESLNDVVPHFLNDEIQMSSVYQCYFFLRTEMIPFSDRRLPVFMDITSRSTDSDDSSNASTSSSGPQR